MTNLNRILHVSFILALLWVLVTLAFPYGAAQQYGLIALGVFFVLTYCMDRGWTKWRWTKDKWFYVVCIVFFLLTPIWQLWDVSTPSRFYYSTMEHQMPFLLIGIVGLLGYLPLVRLRWVALTMLVTSIGMFGYVLGNLPEGSLEFSLRALRTYQYHQIQFINSHMTVDLYANVGLIIGLYVCFNKQEKLGWRIVMGLGCFCVFLIQLLTNGRVGLISSLGIVVVMLVYQVLQYRRWLAVILGILMVAGSGLLASRYSRMAWDVVKLDPRFTIWEFSLSEIQLHPLLGYGASTYSTQFVEHAKQDPAMQQYFLPILDEGFFASLEKNILLIHPHSAYLAVWLEYGVVGILIFLLALLLPLCWSMPFSKRIVVILVVGCFAFQAMMEPLGIHLSAMLYMLILLLVHYSGNRLADCQP